MKELNNKIRNNIINSYRLRGLAKEEKLTQNKKDEIYNSLHEIDKKVLFYKKLSNALKELEDEESKRVHK